VSIRTSLVIPCYNEVEGIPHLCARLETLIPPLLEAGPVEVVFVDDGSSDGTTQIIEREATRLPYKVVRHSTNRGLGAALRTGFAATRGEEIVTLDSDCTYDPLQVPALLAVLREGAQVVAGSPYHPSGVVEDVAHWRVTVSKSLSWAYWVILPRRLHTYTSCFRAYRREVLPILRAPDDGFLGVTQLLVSAILAGARVEEVPARLTSRRFGESKLRIIRLSLAHLRYLLSILGQRLVRGKGSLPDAASTVIEPEK
jgi:dolichol-phosphate mannosyltransferase